MQKKYSDISQEELDWRFTRLLGGLQYESFVWDETAGDSTLASCENKYLNMTMEDYFTKFLGISLEKYRLLEYKAHKQYEINGLREEDWSYDKLNEVNKTGIQTFMG